MDAVDAERNLRAQGVILASKRIRSIGIFCLLWLIFIGLKKGIDYLFESIPTVHSIAFIGLILLAAVTSEAMGYRAAVQGWFKRNKS